MSQTEPEILLDKPLATEIAVGKGQFQLLQGTIHWAGEIIKNVIVSQPADRDCKVELFRQANDEIEFIIRIPWHASDSGRKASIALQLDGAAQVTTTLELGNTKLIDRVQAPSAPAHTIGDKPLVAICMAIYQPNIRRLARQLESIICQSYENWVLIISDDASPEMDTAELHALCNLDPRRIRLVQHETNLGFYHNFERALSYVPENTQYIAFADQDDIWYPDKLRKLVVHLEQNACELVYSDMRLVRDNGTVIANSYWQERNNEYRDFDTIFLANTVTGAACLFKRDLLADALPFPPRIGAAFHDHWFACVALCRGKLGYIDETLYDYVQYDDSVIGHCDFEHESLLKRLSRASSTQNNRRTELYRQEYLRLQSLAETLKMRSPKCVQQPTMHLTDGSWRSALKLLKTYFKMRVTRRTTNDAELSLLAGLLLRKWELFRR